MAGSQSPPRTAAVRRHSGWKIAFETPGLKCAIHLCARSSEAVVNSIDCGPADCFDAIAIRLDYFASEPEPFDITAPIDVLNCINPNFKLITGTFLEQTFQRSDLIGT
jgi:hypothetical protein